MKRSRASLASTGTGRRIRTTWPLLLAFVALASTASVVPSLRNRVAGRDPGSRGRPVG